MKIDLNKEIYEGWTVRDFIADLEPFLNMIMRGQSWYPVIKSKEELKKWCMDNQSLSLVTGQFGLLCCTDGAVEFT